jgi:hypothetical protein
LVLRALVVLRSLCYLLDNKDKDLQQMQFVGICVRFQ